MKFIIDTETRTITPLSNLDMSKLVPLLGDNLSNYIIEMSVAVSDKPVTTVEQLIEKGDSIHKANKLVFNELTLNDSYKNNNDIKPIN